MKKSIVISLLTVATLFCTALCSFASTGLVTADTLKVREEPSTDSKVIEYLSAGDEVEILEESEGWCKIQFEGKIGYVATQYINILANTDTNNETVNEDNQTANEGNDETTKNDENNDTQATETQDGTNANMVKVLAKDEKIHITPVINSLVIATLSEEKQIEVVSEVNGWSYIKMGTTSGWVRTENIQQKELEVSKPENNNNSSSQKTVYISGSSVNFRKTPSTSGEIINSLSRNTKVTLITKDESWSEIEYNGDRGYVSTEYISETSLVTTTRSSTRRTGTVTTTPAAAIKAAEETYVPTGNVSGSEVVSYAKQFLGCRYVYGGSSPSGFDCSGFTSYVYRHFGISLNRSSGAQASNGYRVNSNELQLGDILCFARTSGSSTVGHVGIYIGGGQFIHAGNSGTGVIISNVWGAGYYFVTARRVI